MHAWPLTGRAEELRVIAEVLDSDGEGAGVAVVGPAGVGKTRLACAAVAAASKSKGGRWGGWWERQRRSRVRWERSRSGSTGLMVTR
jgi:hypothetical protein